MDTSALLFGIFINVVHIVSSVNYFQNENSFKTCVNSKTNNGVISTQISRSRLNCARLCSSTSNCVAANLCRDGSGGLSCALSTSSPNPTCSGLVPDTQCDLLYMVNPCRNGGVHVPNTDTCQCIVPFVESRCTRPAHECQELYDVHLYADYSDIQIKGTSIIHYVRCNGNGNMRAFFYGSLSGPLKMGYSWEEYKFLVIDQGLFNEFAGTQVLHDLTHSKNFTLQTKILALPPLVPAFILADINYIGFRVLSEDQNYRLEYDSYQCVTSCGSVADGLAELQGLSFSSVDRDLYGCAATVNASWWFQPGCGGTTMSDATKSYKSTWWDGSAYFEATLFGASLRLTHLI